MGKKGSLRDFISREKEKTAEFDRRQKLLYFRDYYLLKVLIVLAVIIGIVWFAHDVFQNKKTIYAGAGVGVTVSESSEKVLTDDFLSYLGKGYKNKVVKYGGDTLVVPQSGDVSSYNLVMAFVSQIESGMFQYLLMSEKQFEFFQEYDFYLDLTKYKDDPRYSDLEFLCDPQGVPAAIRLPESMRSRLQISSEDVYLVFVYSESENELNNKLMEYIFS
ncbi:MAG: hypothetical protein J5636_10695 [Clostridiales bacterium]|nr:hypothetical protein [Clostridiales bacterium]